MNITLIFFYIEHAPSEDSAGKIQKTFVTKDADFFNNLIAHPLSEGYVLVRQETHIVKRVDNRQLHEICKNYFKPQVYMSFNGFLPFNESIDSPSFTKSLLLEKDQEYEPETELEIFLAHHNILKSYYHGKVQFLIQSEREEYSRESGRQQFNQYEKHRLNLDILKKISKTHTASLYTSQGVENLLEIRGIDDNNKPVVISFKQ